MAVETGLYESLDRDFKRLKARIGAQPASRGKTSHAYPFYYHRVLCLTISKLNKNLLFCQSLILTSGNHNLQNECIS